MSRLMLLTRANLHVVDIFSGLSGVTELDRMIELLFRLRFVLSVGIWWVSIRFVAPHHVKDLPSAK